MACSTLLIMNRLLSKNRSTQFTKHDSSDLGKRPPMLPVTHLRDMFSFASDRWENRSLLPAHVRHVVDVFLDAGFLEFGVDGVLQVDFLGGGQFAEGCV